MSCSNLFGFRNFWSGNGSRFLLGTGSPRFYNTPAKSEPRPPPDNSKCINKVILMGRTVAEARLTPLANTTYSSFIMVTNEIRRTKNNELVKRSDFHKVFVYQPFLAKKAHDLITKGTRIYLEGKLNYRRVENQFYSNIVAEKIIFISGANQNYENDDIDEETVVDEEFLNEDPPSPSQQEQEKMAEKTVN